MEGAPSDTNNRDKLKTGVNNHITVAKLTAICMRIYESPAYMNP